VNLGETPSSEFVQCVLWVIRLNCRAVRHTVTLLRAVWQTMRSPHSVRVLIATTTDTGRHRPFAARPMMPAVCSVGVVYYAVVTTRLLLSACCLPLATPFWWHSQFILCYRLLFPCLPLGISIDTALSHNYCINPVIKAIFWFRSCLPIITRIPHTLTAE